MPEPTAWWVNNSNGTYTIWYANPYENGLKENDHAIPLYDGWEEAFKNANTNLKKNERIRCTEDGEFEVYEAYPDYEVPVLPEIEPTPDSEKDIWSQIASSLKEGIDSY